MFDLGGTYRACTPKETLEKLEPMLPKFGITRVANITGLDNIDIPTYVSIRPFSKLLTTSQGKGITHDLAKVSAIMESIEGWYAEHVPTSDLFGSYNSLSQSYHLLDLTCLPSYSFRIAQAELNDFEFFWLKGQELNTGEAIYFPLPLVDLDFTLSHPCGNAELCSASSNGLASGNTFEEAVCHAIYELIERHCWAKSDLNHSRYIDLSSIKIPHIRALLDHLDPNAVRLQVNDITDELGVPAYFAKLSDLTGLHAQGDFGGSGAHLSSTVALSRAITEAIQSRLTVISGSRDDMYPSSYKIQTYNTQVDEHLTQVEKDTHAFVETSSPNSFKHSIDHLLSRLKSMGFEQVIVYEHTGQDRDLGIAVVHVIIPGLAFNASHHTVRAYSSDQIAYFSDLAE